MMCMFLYFLFYIPKAKGSFTHSFKPLSKSRLLFAVIAPGTQPSWWNPGQSVFFFCMKWDQTCMSCIFRAPVTAFLHSPFKQNSAAWEQSRCVGTDHPSSFSEKKHFFKGSVACPPCRQPFAFSEETLAFLVRHSLRHLCLRVGSLVWTKGLLQPFSHNGRLVCSSFFCVCASQDRDMLRG